MKQEEFEKLVVEAVEALPKFFKDKLDNVDLVVEAWPAPEFARGRLLLGLYQGVPLTSRGRGYNLAVPDKISIFQGPIMWVSHGDPQAIKNVVTDTVKHEIAHHFGISDERLQELERK
ncbi:MAG TPA: metallopeptidase family protein [Candidatus Saccharimonadales bacterium]|nr:metallopeptidase family protein [Candidatus Saccharimonadales bacterium]